MQTTPDHASKDAAGGSTATTGSASTAASAIAATPRLNRRTVGHRHAGLLNRASAIGLDDHRAERDAPAGQRVTTTPRSSRRRRRAARSIDQMRRATCSDRLRRLGDVRLGVALHHQHIEPSSTKIGNQCDRDVIEQRGQGHHQRMTGDDAGHQQPSHGPRPPPQQLGLEQGIENPVSLNAAHARGHPANGPAEHHQTDSIVAADMGGGQRRRPLVPPGRPRLGCPGRGRTGDLQAGSHRRCAQDDGRPPTARPARALAR